MGREFNAEDGSFLIQIRGDLNWDDAAFVRMSNAMLQCCKASEGRESLERWIAEGFWYVSWFVKDWTTHPAWLNRDPERRPYFEECYERLHDLASWFFTGECSYTAPMEPL